MNETLKTTMNMIRNISHKSRLSHNRSFGDFLGDRIVQASTETSLLAMIERLAKLMDTDVGDIYGDNITGFLTHANNSSAWPVLKWLRTYPQVAAMLCMLKHELYDEAISSMVVDDAGSDGVAVSDQPHKINIRMTCVSPMAHGSDYKAGNATIFRRMQVLATNGNVLSLPYYAGNAFRGQMRDLLADHFLKSLGLIPNRTKPPVALWFFHALYAGGALCEAHAGDKAIRAKLGGNGASNADAIYEFRNMLPALSLLGCALGNRVLSGRFKISDFRPVCSEWNNGGTIESSSLFEWVYLTRREDHEGHDDNSSMIANCECLRAGTILVGGIDQDMHARRLEISALGLGLRLMKEHGFIGADNRRGLGRVDISVDDIPDDELYVQWLHDCKNGVLEYLQDVKAIVS